MFRYRDASDHPRFTSGAPLLNAAGEVVGINVGKGEIRGHTVGHANHVASLRRHLREAVQVPR